MNVASSEIGGMRWGMLCPTTLQCYQNCKQYVVYFLIAIYASTEPRGINESLNTPMLICINDTVIISVKRSCQKHHRVVWGVEPCRSKTGDSRRFGRDNEAIQRRMRTAVIPVLSVLCHTYSMVVRRVDTHHLPGLIGGTLFLFTQERVDTYHLSGLIGGTLFLFKLHKNVLIPTTFPDSLEARCSSSNVTRTC